MRYISLSEASVRLEVHPNTVRRLLKKGQLRGYKDFRGYYYFKLQDILDLREERRKFHRVVEDDHNLNVLREKNHVD